MAQDPADWTTRQEYFKSALLDDCLSFWFPRCLDREHGGYLHCLDREGSVIDSDKSVWAQGRMSWMLLTLYNSVEQRPEWLEWGNSGLEFLDQYGFDEDGRLFFHLTREGAPIRKRRYAFSEAFASIAYAAHFKATGDSASSAKAILLFDRFTQWHFTPGLMPPKYTATRPMVGIGPLMIALVTAQELRAHLGETLNLESWIDRCLNEIATLFVKEDERVVMETVGSGGEILDHFDGRLLNPGHAIEAAWFIMEEGRFRQDSSLVQLGVKMLDWMWERGWDDDHGGFYYFRDVDGKPIQEYWQEMKFWWPHNEAMIASLMAYRLTGDETSRRRFNEVCEWSFSHFSDPDFGEWYGYLRRDGSVSVPLKGNLWKSFFHLPRSLFMCWRWLGANLPPNS